MLAIIIDFRFDTYNSCPSTNLQLYVLMYCDDNVQAITPWANPSRLENLACD